MTFEKRIKGICLKVSPLGENDRLITLLSDQAGITRFAVPGGRKPRSSLAAAVPLTLMELLTVGRHGLSRVRQIKVIHSYSSIGQQLEALAGAQALSEMCMMLIGSDDPIPGMMDTVLIHLERLEAVGKQSNLLASSASLAICVQALIHLLALGGYALPLQNCCKSGLPLSPPIGQWDWRCSLLPEEGFAIGRFPGTKFQLNPSELALLQRLLKPNLPIGKDGNLMGPITVWLKLLQIVECWIGSHLHKKINALRMLHYALNYSEK